MAVDKFSKPSKRILIFGKSVYLASIRATLQQVSGIELVHGDGSDVNAGRLPQIVIVVTDDGFGPAIEMAEKYPDARVLALNPETHALTALTHQHTFVHTTQDLLDALFC